MSCLSAHCSTWYLPFQLGGCCFGLVKAFNLLCVYQDGIKIMQIGLKNAIHKSIAAVNFLQSHSSGLFVHTQ